MIRRLRLRSFIIRTGTALCVLIAAAFAVSGRWRPTCVGVMRSPPTCVGGSDEPADLRRGFRLAGGFAGNPSPRWG